MNNPSKDDILIELNHSILSLFVFSTDQELWKRGVSHFYSNW